MKIENYRRKKILISKSVTGLQGLQGYKVTQNENLFILFLNCNYYLISFLFLYQHKPDVWYLMSLFKSQPFWISLYK